MKEKSKIKKWYQKPLGYIAYLLILTLPLAEIALRLTNHKPFIQSEYEISSSPSNCLEPDSVYGFHLSEGEFEICINKGSRYTATHLHGRRNWSINRSQTSKKVFMMGCSFTYGMGVNDSETFTAILQGKDTSLNLINFGVPGYGTVQSILQLEHEVEMGNVPNLVVLNFSALHFDRNALTTKYRKDLTIGYARSSDLSMQKMQLAKFPYLNNASDEKYSWCAWDDLYTNWPGRETFALVNYLNSIKDKNSTSEDEILEISKSLLNRFKQICVANHIDFKICFLDEDKRINQLEPFCKKQKIDFANVRLDYTSTSETNLPYDSHPNKFGHEKIANTILPWIKELNDQN